jgi:gluconokinase
MAMMSARRGEEQGSGPSWGRATAIVVVMGVAGSGKTTIGRMLAEQLGVAYAEAGRLP